MGKIIVTINMPDAPKTVLNMMKAPLEIAFKEQMKKQGIAQENVNIKIEE